MVLILLVLLKISPAGRNDKNVDSRIFATGSIYLLQKFFVFARLLRQGKQLRGVVAFRKQKKSDLSWCRRLFFSGDWGKMTL